MGAAATHSRLLASAAVAAGVFGGLAGMTLTSPVAAAAPDCTASGLATTASGVLGEAGGYLNAHPGANDVLTAAANQPAEEAKANVRGYFAGHLNELLDLQRIAQPLTDMKNQCGVNLSPMQLATLLDTLNG